MRTWTSLLPPLAVVPVRRTVPPGIDRVMTPSVLALLTARQMRGWPSTAGHVGATLQLQQLALRLEASGVPAERPVARDDAVAGDDDRDRVVPDSTGRGAVRLV